MSAAHSMLITGKLPAPWKRSGKAWIDLVPGAQVLLPGIGFKLYMDRIDGYFELRLVYRLRGRVETFSAELGVMLDLSGVLGHPCVVIPRAIRPCNDKDPAAVLLEVATLIEEAA